MCRYGFQTRHSAHVRLFLSIRTAKAEVLERDGRNVQYSSTVDQCKISLNLTSKALEDLQSPQMAQKIKLVSKNGAKRRSLIDSNSAESNCG